jgi:hypothetical protein
LLALLLPWGGFCALQQLMEVGGMTNGHSTRHFYEFVVCAQKSARAGAALLDFQATGGEIASDNSDASRAEALLQLT